MSTYYCKKIRVVYYLYSFQRQFCNVRYIIGSPHFDLIYSVWFPREEILLNPRFIAIGWSLQDVNRIHSMGQLFIIVPVILASWHFGVRGFIGALVLAGFAYVLTPFLLKPDSLVSPVISKMT